MSARDPEVCVVTGMSGAGKSAAANVLEDLGFWVVDNLPPSLLVELVRTVSVIGDAPRVAVVADVRGGSLFGAIHDAIDDLTAAGIRPSVLFLEASDEALVRRFESARRPHPLQAGDRILDGIVRERDVLGSLRGRADLVVDSSGINVHQLGHRLRATFASEGPVFRVLVMSFGFKYGIPVDADMVADLRFLPNPYWIPELRAHTGLESEVATYVLDQPRAPGFLECYGALLEHVIPGYLEEGKHFLTVAVGCTGGKHRSVATAEALAALLATPERAVGVVHRDLGRE